MLLKVYPEAVHDTTEEGYTLLSLAQSTATPSHPNYALIDMLQREMDRSSSNPRRMDSPLHMADAARAAISPSPYTIPTAVSLDMSPPLSTVYATTAATATTCAMMNHDLFLDSARSSSWTTNVTTANAPCIMTPTSTPARRSRRAPKRTRQQLYDDPVGLLLHFSQSGKEGDDDNNDDKKKGRMEHVEV
jgi:hypothetical protein